MSRSVKLRHIVFFAGFVLVSNGVQAQTIHGVDVQAALTNPDVQAAISACQDDRSKLCSRVVPGGGRIIKCLASQEDKVSPGCKSAIYAARDSLAKAGTLVGQAN